MRSGFTASIASLVIATSALAGLAAGQDTTPAPSVEPAPLPVETAAPPPPPVETYVPPPTYAPPPTDAYPPPTYPPPPSYNPYPPPSNPYPPPSYPYPPPGEYPPPGGYPSEMPPPCPAPPSPCGPPPGGYPNMPPPCPAPPSPCGPPPGGYPGMPPPGGFGDPMAGDFPSCPPGAIQCMPPPGDPCAQKLSETGMQVDALMRSMFERGRAFQDEFAQARAAFARERPLPEAWRTFQEEWMQKGRTLFESLQSETQAQLSSLLGDCANHIHMPPMPNFAGPPPGGAMGGGPMDGRPPMDPYGRPPDEQRLALHGKADTLRRECEDRIRNEVFVPGVPPDPAMQQRAHEIMRECEAKIREAFEEDFDASAPDRDGGKESFGSFEMVFDEGTGQVQVYGRSVRMQGNEETQMIEQVTCRGALVLDRLYVNGLLDEFSPEDTGQGTALRVSDAGDNRILSIHDNPRCVINVAASDLIPSVTLDLADHLECETNNARDLECTGDGTSVRVLLHGADIDATSGNELKITGTATFLVQDAGNAAGGLGAGYEDAIASKQVAAEIQIALDGDGLAVDAVPIGDVTVAVEGEQDHVTATIDSAQHEGKVVVLAFGGDTFTTDALEVSLSDVAADGNETPMEIVEAEDLADALVPPGADDAAKYWIVQDKNGFHVLVGIPHFSEKKVTVQAADATTGGGLPVPGFGAAFGLAGLGVAALAVAVVLRRRD